MNPELIRRTQQFLFASEEEKQKEHVPQDGRQRIYRLRDMYSYWIRNPKLGDKHILAEIKRRNGIGDTQAYEDLRLLKLCLGNLQQMTRDWYQYLFIARCEEGFKWHATKAMLEPSPKSFHRSENSRDLTTRCSPDPTTRKLFLSSSR